MFAFSDSSRPSRPALQRPAVRKALVVALGKIGDLVLVTPILRALRRVEPRPEIHFLAGSHNHHVLAGHSGIDRLHVYPAGRALATLPLLGQLRRERYDLWIDPKDHHSHTGRLLVMAAAPACSIGYNGNQRGDPRPRGCFTFGISGHRQNDQRHATERALLALAAAGLPGGEQQPWLEVSPDAERCFSRFRHEHHLDRYALVNLSAQSPERRWRTENWLALLRGPALRDLPVVINALPADVEEAGLLAVSRERVFHYRSRSAGDLLPVVRDAEFVVTVDTGVVHIASAFDTPIVALYIDNPLQYRKYRPLSRRSRAVMSTGANGRVTDIAVASVEEALRSLRAEVAADGRVEGGSDAKGNVTAPFSSGVRMHGL